MTILRPAFLFLLALCSCGLTAHAAQSPAPRLLVILVVDQFRADYLERFGPWLGEGGFRRLQREGTHFTNARYHHAITQTAAGHAQMSTGAFAERHGIIGNDWLDRDEWAMVNSVEDTSSPLVGVTPAELGPEAALNPAKSGRSPRHLLIDTLADALKARDGDRCRVVSVSAKDRATILLGGRRGDVALWQEAGRFISSRYYGPALPDWVNEFNRTHRPTDAFGTTWERLLPAAVYEKVQGTDDAVGEETGLGLGRTFPHPINGGEAQPGRRFLVAWENTPLAADHLAQFAAQAITQERLGHHAGTDFLGVSFSSFDELGHRYGPDSHEIMDAFLRLDRVIAQLLGYLDREVGLDRCVIALTGDHGVAPLPERQAAPGASRLKLGTIDTRLRAALDARFGSGPAEGWFRRDNLAYHVTPAAARQVGDSAQVSRALVTALRAMPEIALAMSAEEIAAVPATGDPLAAAFRRSWHADRRRDVLFFPKAFVVPRDGTGTTHGTPWDYDTRVPLIFRGPGIPAGAIRNEDMGIENLAPTLAARAGLTMPQAQGHDLFRAP
jgi:predicted AlkP superfamily pyrophosphatase or phosphodiesterase